MFYTFLGEGVISVCELRYSFNGVDTIDEWDDLGFVSRGNLW